MYQSRFHSFAIGSRYHLLNVIRYVEANALRADLVQLADDWRWGSLWDRPRESTRVLSPLSFDLPADWVDLVNRPPSPKLTKRLLESIERERPYGPSAWVKRLESQIRPRAPQAA